MTSDKIFLPKVTGGIGCHGTHRYGWKEKRREGGKGEKCTKRQTAAKESRSFLQNECDYCGGRAAFKANTKRSFGVE